MEDDLAYGQTPGSRSLPGVTGRRHAAETVETCKDHPAEETEQGRLHHCQGMEADLTARNIRQYSRTVVAERISHAVETHGLLPTRLKCSGTVRSTWISQKLSKQFTGTALMHDADTDTAFPPFHGSPLRAEVLLYSLDPFLILRNVYFWHRLAQELC